MFDNIVNHSAFFAGIVSVGFAIFSLASSIFVFIKAKAQATQIRIESEGKSILINAQQLDPEQVEKIIKSLRVVIDDESEKRSVKDSSAEVHADD